MKTIYLVGFRGVGYRMEAFKDESLLIKVGHVGFAFEGEEGRVFGFHPTTDAARAIGEDAAIIAHLKRLQSLPGTVHDDTAIFRRAHALAVAGVRTQVWQFGIPVSDDEFDRIRALVWLWYTEQKTFPYAFPSEELTPDSDNCATFPRRLGLPLPEPTGQLVAYVPRLAASGQRWQPKEDTNDHPTA